MALSDCSKCWDTPCTCGYYYRDFDKLYLSHFIVKILSYFSVDDAKEIIERAHVINCHRNKDDVKSA